MTANIALKRQMFTLSHFTEGNIPESLIGVPDSWTPDQIKNFQDYWDAYFTGDLAARRRAKFVPGGVAKTFIQTKEPELKGVFDEWLARLIDGVLIEDFGEEDIEFAPRIYLGRGRPDRRGPAGASADELRRRRNPDALAKRARSSARRRW
jgi:hypothetical protein